MYVLENGASKTLLDSKRGDLFELLIRLIYKKALTLKSVDKTNQPRFLDYVKMSYCLALNLSVKLPAW